MTNAYTLFDTAIGRCAIAWHGSYLRSIQLPEIDDAATISRLKRLTGTARKAAPPPFVRVAIEAITAHLVGAPADLDGLSLDLDRVSAFERDVLTACRRIQRGETTTYGALARALGMPQAARAVGAALGRNPWPIVIPCHRVVAANGKLGGFSASGGRDAKLRLLAIEGAMMPGDSLDLFERRVAAVGSKMEPFRSPGH